MNKNDLRYIKTEENIENALIDLLQRKNLNSIRVTELTRAARINKSTFYLHYIDIYDLYKKMVRKKMRDAFKDSDFFPAFFTNPASFVKDFTVSIQSSLPEMEKFSQGERESRLLYESLEILRTRLYQTGYLKVCPYNDAEIDALFAGILTAFPTYRQKEPENAEKFFVEKINDTLPHLIRAGSGIANQ